MTLPSPAHARPLRTDAEQMSKFPTNIRASSSPNSQDINHRNIFTSHQNVILHRLAKQLNVKVKESNAFEAVKARSKRWNADILAWTLLDSSPEQMAVPYKRSDAVALYDPFGGGNVWGKKKRSISDSQFDFDYEGDDL